MNVKSLGTAFAIAVGLYATSASASYFGMDGNFQSEGASNNFGGNTYCYFNGAAAGAPTCSVNSPWTGQLGPTGGGAGMIESGSAAWGGLAAPNNEGYYGFVQISGVLTDTFTSTATGNFVLSWLDTNRAGGCSGPCGPEGYDVSISHGQTTIDLGQFTPATFGAWENQLSHQVFQLLANTTYTISFTGLGSYPPDSTAFIDDLTLTAVPEPMGIAMFGSALLGLGLLRRRWRKG